MSIIRDLLEYYRLPAEVRASKDDFRNEHGQVYGFELRYYYKKGYADDGVTVSSDPYRQTIDNYDREWVRYLRTNITYTDDFVVTSIINEYDYGAMKRTQTYTGSLDIGKIDSIAIIEEVVVPAVIWTDKLPSTGWPNYNTGGSGGLKWIRHVGGVSDGIAKAGTGYLIHPNGVARSFYLPDNAKEGDVIAIADEPGHFNTYPIYVRRKLTAGFSNIKIMGLTEDLVLNERYQGVQLVYDGDDDWRIVWATPLVAEVTLP